MIDFNTLTEDQKRIATEFPEFSSILSKTPVLESTSPEPLGLTPEMASVATEFPEFSGLREKMPGITPPPTILPKRLIPVENPPFQAQELPERGIGGDVLSAVAGGFKDVAEMGLRSLRTLSPFEKAYEPGGIASEALKKIEETDKWEIMKPSRDVAQGPWYRRWIYEGIRSGLPSLGSMVAGAAAGTAVAGPLGTIPGMIVGSAAGPGLFGLSEYDRFMEEGKQAGLPEADVRPYAIASGLTEWGGETIGNYLGAKILGLTGTKTLTQPLKNTIRQMFKTPLKEGAKDLIKELINEAGTEAGQDSLETYLRIRAGMPQEQTPFEAGIDAVGPTVVMTALFGLGAGAINKTERGRIYKALNDPRIPADERKRAAFEVTQGLAEASREAKDPETAQQLAEMGLKWDEATSRSIDLRLPINVDQTIEQYLSQAQATPTEKPKETHTGAKPETLPPEETPPAPRPGAELLPQQPGPGVEVPATQPRYEAGHEVEIGGQKYTIVDPLKYKRWENKKVAKEKVETLLRKGVITEAPAEQITETPKPVEQTAPEEKHPGNAPISEGQPAPTLEAIAKSPEVEQAAAQAATSQKEAAATPVTPEVSTLTIGENVTGTDQRGKSFSGVVAEINEDGTILVGNNSGQMRQFTPEQLRRPEASPAPGIKTPQEHFKEKLLPEMPKSNPMKMIKPGDTYVTTKTGEVSNGHWLLKNEAVPEGLREQIEKLKQANRLGRTAENMDASNLAPTQPKPATYEFSFENAVGTKAAAFSTPTDLAFFDADYVGYLYSKIPGFSLGIEDGKKPAIIYSEGKAVGLLMPREDADVAFDGMRLPSGKGIVSITEKAGANPIAALVPEGQWKPYVKPEPQQPKAKKKPKRVTEKPIETPAVEQSAPPMEQAAPPPSTPGEWGSKNKVFTKERADRAREILRKKAGELRTGIDPELLTAGIDLAGYHIEAGARKFIDYAHQMITDAGEWIRPYLKSFYNAVRDYPGFDAAGMDGHEVVAKMDVDKLEETPTMGEEGVSHGQPESRRTEVPGPVPLEETSAEVLQRPEEIGEPGESRPGGGEEYPGGLPEGEGGPGEERLAGGPGERVGMGAGERGVAAPAERGPAELPRGEQPGTPATPEHKESAEKGVHSGNFRVTPEVTAALLETGKKTKTRRNIEAIRLLKQIESENRMATVEEQAVLAQYSGWGGLPQAFSSWGELRGEHEILEELLTEDEFKSARASTPNAHYTTPEIASWIWKALEKMGLKGGRSLDPAMGTGIFFGSAPESLRNNLKLTGIELDSISGRISRQLFQDADIRVMGFQDTRLANDFFDVAVSNVPFGDYKVFDKPYNKFNANIHDYFFIKSLDKVRPGGMVAFITSRYTMDKQDQRIRKILAEKTDLVAAFRLPDSAFKQIANTEVVTDILFLRKKVPGEEFAGQPWTDTQKITIKDRQGEEETFDRNEYYAAHPDHILGVERATGKMYAEGLYNVEPKPGDLRTQMDDLLPIVPGNVISGRDLPAVSSQPVQVQVSIEAPDHVKEGAFVLTGGQIWRKEGDQLVQQDIPTGQSAKTRQLITLRDLARDLLHTELQGPEEEVPPKMEALNKAYDKFIKLFGPIHESKNVRGLAFAEDPDYSLVLSLEKWDIDHKTATKADIFQKRVVATAKRIEHVETSKEALLVNLSEAGRIDFGRMMELTGKSEQQIQNDLAGLIFKNPEGERWETADEYLSGNVRDKLKVATSAAATDPSYASNMEALKAVQPQDLTFDQIDANMGSAWIPTDVVSAFTRDVLGISQGLKIGYSPAIGVWVVERPKPSRRYRLNAVENMQTFGTNAFRGDQLLELGLNHKQPVVKYKDEEGKEHFNVAATEEAREKLYALKERFKQWIWEDSERRDQLSKKYNEEMNNLRSRTFDGSHLQLPGSSNAIHLMPHQKDAVWRIVQSPTTLLAHVVGAGKTFSMIGGAMELRRLGIVKKPMFVVPNHLLEQWGGEFLRLYPSAKVLAATADDFTKDKRDRLMSRIATGDWDAVIVPHSSFGKIPMSKEAQIGYLQKQLDQLEQSIMELVAGGEEKKTSRIIKEIEKKKRRLENRLHDLMNEEVKNVNVTFEELGIDQLFVDEAHKFKNLYFTTGMGRIAGISNSDAQRATDLHMKSSYLLDKFGRGIVFATGTPVSNTMAEMYTMQRYLQPKILEQYGVQMFDSWAGNFGEVVRSVELSPESVDRFITRDRFKQFINVPELLQLFHSFADVKMAEDLKLPVPLIEGGQHKIIVSPASDDLRAYVQTLVARAERVRSRAVDPRTDNMLKITTDGRKAALDMRIIHEAMTSGSDSKVVKAANNIYQIWKETERNRLTQAIFIDFSTPDPHKFNVYHDLRSKLTALGIPKEEIAFIHDYDTEQKKQNLFNRVNSGTIRVLFGSTEKMGMGTNIQSLLVAQHHLDAPWKPADIEQRDGRILRQGNTNSVVKIYRYVTEGSFDAYMWQILENKAHSIAQVMTNRMDARRIEDIEGATLSFAEVKALATGDPNIIEKVKTDSEVRRLEILKKQWQGSRFTAQDRIAKETQKVGEVKTIVENLRADIENHKLPEKFSIRIKDRTYTDRKEAGEAIQKIAGKMFREFQEGKPKVPQVVGEFAGYPLVLGERGVTDRLSFSDRVKGNFSAITESAQGTIQSLEYAAGRGMKQGLQEFETDLTASEKAITKLQEELGKPFQHEEALKKLLARQEELNALLGGGEHDQTVGEQGELEGAEEEEETPEAEHALYRSVGGREGVFDRYGYEVSGRTVEDIQKAIAPIVQRWHLGRQVSVVQAVEDVPEKHRNPNMAAVFARPLNNIILVADRLKDKEDAQRRLFHEALAHFGFHETFGRRAEPFLMDLYKRFGREGLADIADLYGFDLNTREGRLRAASEKLARIAEETGGEPVGILSRAYAAVRRFLRDLGFDLELTDEEIRIALARTARELGKPRLTPGKVENLRRAVHDMEYPGEYALTENEPLTRTVTQDPFDFIKNFKARYSLDIKDPDLKKLTALCANPWHIGKKHPEFRSMIDIEMRREEAREQLLHQFLSNTVKASPNKIHEFLMLPQDQAENLFKVMVWCDANNEFFTREEDLLKKAKELGVDLSKEQISAYYAWKRTMNLAWKTILDQAEHMTFRPFEGKPWADDLKTIAMTKRREVKNDEAKAQALKAALKRVEGLDKVARSEFDRALSQIQRPANRIRALRTQMGRIKYYIPRQREQGKYVVRVYDDQDNVLWRENAKWEHQAAQIRDRLKKQFPNGEVGTTVEKAIPESIFQEISDTSIQKFIDRAIERARRKETISEEDAGSLRNALIEAVVEQLKGRGFGEHMIARKEGPAIGGYETRDGKKVFMDYISGLSGFLTKQEAAFDFYKGLHAIDLQEKPTLYQYANDYVKDMLRNTTDLERLSGKARSIAFASYLAGNLKSAAIQMSQNFVTGIPFLGRETKKPQKKYLRAMRDVAMGSLSEEETRALHEAIDKGITTNQFLQEITGRVKSGFSSRYEKMVEVLAKPFSGMEIFNRKSAFLAMFRVGREEKHLSFEEAVQKARDYVYDTHYLYGKANLPSWARAGTTGGVIARTAYTFRSFMHNYLLSLARSLHTEDGKIALDVIGRSLAYTFAFGGLAGLPWLDDLLDEAEKLFGVPYRKNIREGLKGIGGQMLERFGMEGLPALIGVDLSGSLKIGLPRPSLKGVEESVYGVYGGLLDKGQKAFDAMAREDFLRAVEYGSPTFLENLFKAYRMYNVGATTPTGKVIFDEYGKPVRLSLAEAIGQAASFRPERVAEASMEKRSLANIEAHYKAKRDDLYSRFRLATTGADRQEIIKDIQRYNLDVQKYRGAIPFITRDNLRQSFVQKPERSLLRFEQSYA